MFLLLQDKQEIGVVSVVKEKLCQLMEQLRPKTDNPLDFFPLYVFLMLRNIVIFTQNEFNFKLNNKEKW